MTYCLAVHVKEGLIFCSDSRTNAGVDQVSTYSKMFNFSVPGERQVVICSAGNLATTQAVIKTIERDIEDGAKNNLLTLPRMERIADYVGEISVARQAEHTGTGGGIFEASFLVGGEVAGGKPEIYLVYPQGNHITATQDTPYLQIGEVKYGKPILDRSISCETPLETATVCALLSMDSTVRSNVTVGPPIELLALESGTLSEGRRFKYDADDADMRNLHNLWEEKLREAVASVPFRGWAFDWSGEASVLGAEPALNAPPPGTSPGQMISQPNGQVTNGQVTNGQGANAPMPGAPMPNGTVQNGLNPQGNTVSGTVHGQNVGQNGGQNVTQNLNQNQGGGQHDQSLGNPIRNPL